MSGFDGSSHSSTLLSSLDKQRVTLCMLHGYWTAWCDNDCIDYLGY